MTCLPSPPSLSSFLLGAFGDLTSPTLAWHGQLSHTPLSLQAGLKGRSLSGKPFLPSHSLPSSRCDLSCHPFPSPAVSKTTNSSYWAVRGRSWGRQGQLSSHSSPAEEPPVLSENFMVGGKRSGLLLNTRWHVENLRCTEEEAVLQTGALGSGLPAFME